MMKYKFITLILAMSLLAGVALAGQPIERGKASLQKTSVNDVFAPMDINNIFSYYKNNGDGSLNPYTGDGGFEIISANRGITVFEEGLVFGGYHRGVLKVGGSTYNQGWQAGPILTPAVVVNGVQTAAPVAADPNDPKYRLYRVRPDVKYDSATAAFVPFAEVEAVLNQEIELYAKYDANTTAQSLYDAYVADWKEWPADEGAPYKDVNGNGKYDWQIDIPGVPGADQTMWYVANDLDVSRAHHLYGSDPIGIELQKTIWAYRLSGALGNTIFQKNKIINKSGFPIDSMYVGQWADCDNGGGLGYKDDFTGCDSVLGLGFTYNGTNNDGFYGPKPPAIGFDFFQGPIIPSNNPNDRAIFNGAYRYGYKNLNMTGFNFFINSNNLYRDPTLDSPKGTPEMYNLLKGLIVTTGAPNVDPTTHLPTKFALSGDPVTGKGWIDGTIAGPDDRRQIQTTGPFTMAAGDTQEVVVGELAAQAYDRLSSVALLKYFDRQAQSAYDQFFDLPKPPAQPSVVATPLDKEVVLDWSKSTAAVEGPAPKGYAFQGYNVYQLPGAGFTNAKLLATYDLADAYGTIVDTVYSAALGALVYIPVQNGNNQGISRYFDAKMDYINNKPFVNGQTYYFAVTAYNLNTAPGSSPVSLESAPIVIAVVPQSPKPGEEQNANTADVVPSAKITTTGSTTDGSVLARIINPKSLTGDTYAVKIDTTGGVKKWYVVDVTKNNAVVVTNQRSWGDKTSNPIVDGIQWNVLDPGAAGGINRVVATKIGDNVLATPVSVLRKASPDGKWAIDAAGATSVSSALSRLNWGGVFGTDDYEFRFTANGSEYYIDGGSTVDNPKGAGRIPVEVWDVTKNKQLTIKVLDDNGNGKYDTSNAGISNLKPVAYDRIYVTVNPPYVEPLPAASGASPSSEQPIGRFTVVPMGDDLAAFPPVGTVIKLISNKPLDATNVMTVNTAGMQFVVGNTDQAKLDVQKINVFPNPYFGFNSKEPNKYNRFVTFNHLPKSATLNIINLAGVRVRTITKNDDSQFINWDLTNSSGLPVAAGMYIVYIDMGSLGTKVVKLALIPEAQQLDRY